MFKRIEDTWVIGRDSGVAGGSTETVQILASDGKLHTLSNEKTSESSFGSHFWLSQDMNENS